MGLIEENRRRLDGNPKVRKYASPAIFGLESTLEGVIDASASGAALDVGCGAMPYRDRVLAVAETYDGLDVEARHSDVRYVASATNMAEIPDGSYDTVLCSEVLEHVAEPTLAMAEIARVLRPGGTVIVSVPFLGRLHEEPHDYVRLTEHGLRVLHEGAGLDLQDLQITGSVGSFLGHQVSTAVVGVTFGIPVLRWVALGVNAVFVVTPGRLIDALLGPLRRLMPLGYVSVATKAERSH